jgi:hypothetical protein
MENNVIPDIKRSLIAKDIMAQLIFQEYDFIKTADDEEEKKEIIERCARLAVSCADALIEALREQTEDTSSNECIAQPSSPW